MSNFLEKIIYLTENQYQQLVQNNQVNNNYLYITNEDGVTLNDLGLTVIDVIHGGTGCNNFPVGEVLVGNGTNPVTTVALKALAYKDSLTTSDIPDLGGTYVKKVTSTDNAIVRFNGTDGTVQNSKVTIDDNGNILVSHATSNDVTATSANPKITFAESGTQPVHLIYSDYDSYRSPAGLKVVGGTSATPAWFEAEGSIFANGGYRVPHTGNTTGTVGGTTVPVYIESGIIKAGTALGESAYHPDSYFKTTQTAVTDNTASTDATTTFVQAVTQNANGEITVIKAPLNTSGTWSGNATTSTSTKYVKLYEARGSTTSLNKAANFVGAGAMFHLIASSSTSSAENGKTPTDANILQMNWDNGGGYDSQLGIATGAARMYFRPMASQKAAWREVAHAPVSTQVGTATQPIYMSNTGELLAGTALADLAYISKGTGTTKFLREDGTWQTALTDSPVYTAVSGKKPTENQTPDFGDTFDIEQVGQDTTGQVSVTERTVKIPDTAASTSAAGLVNTSAQSFKGIKTFYDHYTNGHIASLTTATGQYAVIRCTSKGPWMTSFHVRMYTGYESYTLEISGYNYNTNNWYAPKATMVASTSTSKVTVTFGYDNDATNNYKTLWVAIPVGNYPGIDVQSVVTGHSDTQPRFSVTIESGVPATAQTTVDAYRPWYRNETVTNATNASAATTATKFASAQSITLTGDVTGTASSQAGWSIATTIGTEKVTNAMLAGSIANNKLINSKVTIAGNDVSLGGSLAASTLVTSLGLSKAMRFIGVATVAITDGSTTDPVISGYSTKTAGDVIIDKDSAYEYVWSTTGKWERLGGDSSYKVTQTAVTTVTAETTADTVFVSSVTQNENGEITVKTRPLDTSGNWDGTATKLQTTRTLWGQNFDGSANVTGNLIDVGDQIKLISGKTELQFLTSNGGAVSGKFGKIGINSTYANANLTDYVLDVDGKTRLNSATAASATNLSSQLIISNSNSNAVALELWRNTKASWQIINDSGYLYFKNNWTSAKQNTYSQTGLIMDYNTGNTAFAGKVSVGQTTRNTSYTLYINGTAYVNGATSLNSTLTASGATTINNTLTVSGATTINNTINVTGEATFDDDVTIAGTATIGDIIVGSGTSQNMIVTSGNNLDMVLSPTGKLCLYQGGSSGTAKVILNGNTFYPYTDNQVSLGIDGNAWKELYAKTIITTPAGSSTKPIYISSTTKQITESDATVGSQYQPVYLSSGTITAAYPVQYLSWTFANANDNQVVFSNQLLTASTYVLSIVVTSGESNLNGPITWTSGAGTLTLSTSPVTGVVSGYILISFGADLSSTISGTSSHSNT